MVVFLVFLPSCDGSDTPVGAPRAQPELRESNRDVEIPTADLDVTDTDDTPSDLDLPDLDANDAVDESSQQAGDVAPDTELVDLDEPDEVGESDPDILEVTEPDTGEEDVNSTISVAASGMTESTQLVMGLNEDHWLEFGADGARTFAESVPLGESFAVTVMVQPSCPDRFCDVSGGSGVADGSPQIDVTVTCREPDLRLFTSNWNLDVETFGAANGVLITDHIEDMADGDTAEPRALVGDNTTFAGLNRYDGVAVDWRRDLMYVGINSEGVAVFDNASTITGDVPPVKVISAGLRSVEIDSARDRLYTGAAFLRVFDNASELLGHESADVTISMECVNNLHLDTRSDTLYVADTCGGTYVHVFESASRLRSWATADRVIHIVDDDLPHSIKGLYVDACSDRMVVANNLDTLSGHNVFVFSNASTLDGAYEYSDDSVAQHSLWNTMFLAGEGDRLYLLRDEATQLEVFSGVDVWSGVVAAEADRSLNGVVSGCYGVEVSLY